MLGCQKYLSVLRSDGNDQQEERGGGKGRRVRSDVLRRSLVFLRYLDRPEMIAGQDEGWLALVNQLRVGETPVTVLPIITIRGFLLSWYPGLICRQ